MPRSLQEILDQADEFADRFEDYDPGPDDMRPVLPTREALDQFAGAATSTDVLRVLTMSRSDFEAAIVTAVRVLRAHGEPWTSIGAELGTSGEAARQRYADLISH